MAATGRSFRNAIFAPFRRRFLGVALLRLRAFLVTCAGIIANLSFLREKV
jgi:hypothetical protein